MSKTNIKFNGADFSRDDIYVVATKADLKLHFSSTMNGTGATINFAGTSYDIDSAKLSGHTNWLIEHFGTIAGDGHKVKVGNVEYSIDSDKIASTISELEAAFAEAGTLKPSEGLAFTSNDDGTCYVSGIGDCTDTHIVIPTTSPNGDSVTSIGDHAFDDCANFVAVVIPDSVLSIGEYAFNSCGGLLAVMIPDSVTSIGERAFASCARLTEIVIPDSVNSIGASALHGCTGLTSVVIGDGVTSIGARTFILCAKLTSVVIGKNVTTIGASAFQQCYALTSITIPNSVTFIDKNAFYKCTGLTEIHYDGTEAEWNAISKDATWNSNVPATYVQCSDGQVAL